MRNKRQDHRGFISAATWRGCSAAQPVCILTSHDKAARLTLAVLMWLAVAPSVSQGRAPQSLPAATPLDLQITEVRRLASLNHSATAGIEIRWTARVPRFTTLGGFDVQIDVRYSDGSRSTVRSDSLKSTARSATLQVPMHPKTNIAAALKAYHASLRARSRVASSVTVVQQIIPDGGNNQRTGTSSAGQPEVFITEAKLARGCAADRQCVDVRWTASAPRNVAINEFTASVEATHKNGARSLDSKTVSGSDRQTKLLLGPIGSEVNSIKVSLLTSFSSLDFKTVVKEGAL